MKQETYNCLATVIGVITFLVVFWYAIVTRRMQKAVAKQAEEVTRQIRPSIMPAFTAYVAGFPSNPSLKLINIGNGTAVNVEIDPLDLIQRETLNNVGVEAIAYFSPILQIRAGVEVLVDHHEESKPPPFGPPLLFGKLSPNGANDEVHKLRLRFRDIEGTKYQQTISMSKNKSKPSPVEISND